MRRSRIKADEIHSDLEQDQREEVLMKFKSRSLPVLVATDILSRGIDIDNIDLVINYDVPHDGEDYVHRIGRTARAAAEGTAYTFISPKEQRKFLSIERLLGKPVTKATVPPEFGEVPDYNSNPAPAGRRNEGGAKKKFFKPRRHNNSGRGN